MTKHKAVTILLFAAFLLSLIIAVEEALTDGQGAAFYAVAALIIIGVVAHQHVT